MEPNVATAIDPSPAVTDNLEPREVETILDAVAAPEIRRPTAAIRTSRFPYTVFTSANLGSIQAIAGQGLFDPWEVPANGYLLISGAIAFAASRWQISVDNGNTFIDLNNGVNLSLNTWYDGEVVHVAKGRRVTVGVSADTSVIALDVFFIADA